MTLLTAFLSLSSYEFPHTVLIGRDVFHMIFCEFEKPCLIDLPGRPDLFLKGKRGVEPLREKGVGEERLLGDEEGELQLGCNICKKSKDKRKKSAGALTSLMHDINEIELDEINTCECTYQVLPESHFLHEGSIM